MPLLPFPIDYISKVMQLVNDRSVGDISFTGITVQSFSAWYARLEIVDLMIDLRPVGMSTPCGRISYMHVIHNPADGVSGPWLFAVTNNLKDPVIDMWFTDGVGFQKINPRDHGHEVVIIKSPLDFSSLELIYNRLCSQ